MLYIYIYILLLVYNDLFHDQMVYLYLISYKRRIIPLKNPHTPFFIQAKHPHEAWSQWNVVKFPVQKTLEFRWFTVVFFVKERIGWEKNLLVIFRNTSPEGPEKLGPSFAPNNLRSQTYPQLRIIQVVGQRHKDVKPHINRPYLSVFMIFCDVDGF